MHQLSVSAPELLTTAQVAEVLQVPVASVVGWRERRRGGTGPRFVRVGRYVRYRREDVRAFIEEQSSTTPKPKIVRLLSPEHVADQLGVSTDTLARWMNESVGPTPLKLSEACIRYRLSDVEAWLARKAEEARS